MILAIDTSTAACSAALFADDGQCLARRDERIGRGHSERLVPMLEEMLAGRTASIILAGAGPGSFTGIRVGIAAAQGLAIGWDADVRGMSSLALLAAGAAGEPVAAAMLGGHGELFVQQFAADLSAETPALNLPAGAAAERITAARVIGTGASALVAARGSGEAMDAWPCAANALLLPEPLRNLVARPVYARDPDARAREAA